MIPLFSAEKITGKLKIKRNSKTARLQQGSILIIVLWLITLGLILVTAIASNIRLSATTVIHHQQALKDWSAVLDVINKARLELLIEKMPKVEIQKTALYQQKSEENRFDGRPLKLHYETPENITVRIYDLSSKLNISRLSQQQMQQLFEHIMGGNNKQIPELVDAWLDWIDTDELKHLNGAEKAYYKKQGLGYEPRNGPLVTVEELRLIKGLTEVFKGIELDSVFTLYGGRAAVNPNTATREVLMMIPGIDKKSVNNILQARKTQDFKNAGELNLQLTPSVIAKTKNWFTFSKSSFYSIVVYPSDLEDPLLSEQVIYAYKEDVRVTGYTAKPVILQVNPYAKIKLAQ
jgi:general secretion pathway protein K